jgi:hypothetical protein
MLALPAERLLALALPIRELLFDPVDEASIRAGSASSPSSLRASIVARSSSRGTSPSLMTRLSRSRAALST